MDKTQEVFIRKSITEFASTNRLSLNDRDIENALNLFFECGRHWSENPNKAVEDIAQSIGINQPDEHICKVVLGVWTDIYFD